MRFHNYPGLVDRAAYDRALDSVVSRLSKTGGVTAVYQLGGTSAPGISDLDVLAVFDDDASCAIDPRDHLEGLERYVFTHGVFAVSRSRLADAIGFGAYEGLRLVHGRDDGQPTAAADDVKRQTALEFLLMNYIGRTIDTHYGVASVRNLLLSTHAIRFDLDLLGIGDGPLRDHVTMLSGWRNRWFVRPVTPAEMRAWWRGFVPALESTLAAELLVRPLAIPALHPHRLGRHVTLRAGAELSVRRRGVLLPRVPGLAGRRYVRLQNRVNRFHAAAPAETAPPDNVLSRRFAFYREMLAETRQRFPRCTPLLNNFVFHAVRT